MKVALVEIGGSHDECLYSQIRIIKSHSNIHLTLVCNEVLEGNTKHFDLIDEKVFVSVRSGFKQWLDLFRIWQTLRAKNFEKIIFNTAQGRAVSRLFRFPFKNGIEFYGILHDTSKVSSSHSQRFISKRMDHYFVLSHYLLRTIKNDSSYSVFFPVYFPDYQDQKVSKEEGEIWICVPGQVELKRRDYTALFDSIQEFGVAKNIKFLLLGRCEHSHGDGSFVKKRIAELSVSDNFFTWDEFVPVSIFYSLIKNSDYIMPLIHEDHISGNLYKNQISGAYNLAVAYSKPILAELDVSEKMLSEYNPITYEKRGMMKTINQLGVPDVTNLYSDNKWSFDFQRKLYLESIGIPEL